MPTASRAALVDRAALFAEIRSFFAERQVLEVDTPLLARYGVSDPAIDALVVERSAAADSPLFLQTSPEFAMKRLLAANTGAIYQLGKAFRDGEHGKRHNPEFTLLEWYRPGFNLDMLIGEVADLVCTCLGRDGWRRRSYRDLFIEVLEIDPWAATPTDLAKLARSRINLGPVTLDRDGWLDLLMSHCVEPALEDEGVVFVDDYPPSQAALARCCKRGDREVAERFELYVDGIELANGYRELLDPRELERRAEGDNAARMRMGKATRRLDPRLVAAMDRGLPDCSGVALGVDRLLWIRRKAVDIAAVMPFAWRCS